MSKIRRAALPALSIQRELALIGAIYDAGLDPRLWQAVIAQIAFAGCADAALLFRPFAESVVHLRPGCEINSALMLACVQDFAEKNLRMPQRPERGSESRDTTTGEFASNGLGSDRTGTSWHRIAAPYRIHGVAGILARDADAFDGPPTALVLFRSLQRKRFGRGPLSLLCRLGPHLRRSIDTNWTIARRAQRTSISEAVLSHLPSAVVVCRADGQVVFVNAAAKRLLSRADGITSRDGYIGQPTFERQRRLHKLIAETCRAGARHIDALVVSRPSKRRTMTLIVRALTGAPSGGNAQACGHALMVVAENDIALGCAGDLLQHSFGLTRAEVRLMDAMLYGGSLPDIALKLGVSHSTVRTQMRSLFDKTGTHRQNELIKLILRVHAAPLHEVDPGTHEMQEAL